MNERKWAKEPIDKLAIALIVSLAAIMTLLIWGGNACGNDCLFHAGAKVSYFSWRDRTVGVRDRAFILAFNRPMDRQSVAENLKITPSLPGKISWSGLRLAYTLDEPPPYGESYSLTLEGATDRFPNQEQAGETIQPFQAEFSTRDRALAYVGTVGEEAGRLVLYNWTRQEKRILTPPDLAVFDFKPNAQGNLILFSAADPERGVEGIRYLELYTVPTGLNDSQQQDTEIELILDNRDYQNNKFDLSADGKTIVVQRLERNNTNNYGLWKITPGKSPQLINNDRVGDFLITPDGQTVAVAQGEGIALLPLKPDARPLDFLPRFGQVLSFTADGTGAATIDYNTDSEALKYTRSLYYINSQGIEKELLNTEGSIQSCQFDATAEYLYCWLTKLKKGKQYTEIPYLAQIQIKTGKISTLLSLSKYKESKLSVAPDNLGILFKKSSSDLAESDRNSIWLYILAADSANTERLPFVGFHPQWLP